MARPRESPGRLALDGIWPVRLGWVMSQRWANLLYLHYRVDASSLRPLVPASLEIEEFDGSAWVSVVPLQMKDVRLRDFLPIPGATDFAEVNMRTYVRWGGVSGVYFISIDAASALASFVARSTFHLPYRSSEVSLTESEGEFHVTCRRSAGDVQLEARYRPTGRVEEPSPLLSFLAERYCMYAVGAFGRLLRGDISHLPWQVQPAEATIVRNDLLAASGVTPLEPDPVSAYSVGSDSKCWLMRPASYPERIWPRR
ncbi:MAG TPA: DUF2071 domain-containing protein [Acidimicrobiales bacterium]|nr:DUF2071 domain-containing protein [Acidimicrobiales bacterium]